MQLSNYIRILSIAGSDSGGGAGIEADLKTISALGCYGMTAITAITAQNTCGVLGVEIVTATMLAAQIKAVVTDIGVDAIKIGMLPNADSVRVVAEAIKEYKISHVVLDPVMLSTSGEVLMAPSALKVLVQALLPLASLITPNLGEASLLLNRPIQARSDLDQAAHDLCAMGASATLIKGGHLAGNEVTDALLCGADVRHFSSPRIVSPNTHGTGCTLSSAIACYLGIGHELGEAVAHARRYVLQAMAAGSLIKLGAGHGPLNHSFSPVPMHII